jgi:hypothetical protein
VRQQFDTSIDALARKNPDAAVVVLTMARLAADAMLTGDEPFSSAAARVMPAPQTPTARQTPAARPGTPSTRNRAVLDPFEVYRSHGRDTLVSRLADLDLDQLRDIIHHFGMDPDKRAMKWKTVPRVRERIVEHTEQIRNRDRAFH